MHPLLARRIPVQRPAGLQGDHGVAEQQLGRVMFWECSNDDGRLFDALRRGLGLPASGRPD
ncbi:MAG: hypothetical protein ABIX28_12480 [Vicinamibacterales bacterium]